MHLPNSLNECSIRDVYARSWISGDALTGESANNRPLLGGVLKKPPTPMAHEVKRGTRASRIERERMRVNQNRAFAYFPRKD